MRGSRFLATASAADTADRALELRGAARRRHHDATHHVVAWRGADGSWRCDDDGEPSGTAGRPVLSALDEAGLRRAVVVVVRWFGGTELGTGGLARAYREAARAALARLPTREAVPGRRMKVRYGYGDTGPVMRVLDGSGAVREGTRYREEATVELSVPLDEVDPLVRSLRDATGGRASTEVSGGVVLVPSRG